MRRLTSMSTPGLRSSAARGVLLLCLGSLLLLGGHLSPVGAEDEEGAATIRNPYFEHTEWKVWRADESPVEDVTNLVREGKKKKPVKIKLEPVAPDKRLYPVDPPEKDGTPTIEFRSGARPSKQYAGMWDDVYSSWSGLHGYVRNRWKGADGSLVPVRAQIMHFVDVTSQKAMVQKAGVNFVHQSTTSMGHAIANGYIENRSRGFEQVYFSDCLVTAPAHASYTDWKADQTSDLYMGHCPSYFNSLGSSNSETMAITKMIIAGAYFSPEMKLLLKTHGLYPAAILHLWKAALPYDVPYAHELRHRIAYKSVGNRSTYPEKYNATALDRGDTSLEFHQYDEMAHMRGMIDVARSMDVALPEAVFSLISTKGGDPMLRLRKSAVVVQETGNDVTLAVSTEGCYDLQDLPLTLRWKVLYGNKHTRIERDPEEAHGWKITVPWDDALPEGRTAIALIANNGRFDSNPAILSVYRQKGDLPGVGLGPGDYKYDLKFANRRPVLLDVQDVWVRRGRTVEIPLRAADPEGFPVAFYKRAGEVGEIDGDLFTWKCPKKAPKGSTHVITIIASDETSGNSYNGRQVTLHVEKPTLLAHIEADVLSGKAPLTVKLSAKKSIAPKGKVKYGWEFYQRDRKRKPKPFDKQAQGAEVEHTFEKPGFYEVALTVQGGKELKSDTQVVGVLVTKGDLPKRAAALAVEGNGLRIAAGDDVPTPFDYTDFGVVPTGQKWVERTFRLVNAGDEPLSLRSKKPITIAGEASDGFRIVHRPRKKLAPRGSTFFTLRFTPKKASSGAAVVEVHAGRTTHAFHVRAGAP